MALLAMLGARAFESIGGEIVSVLLAIFDRSALHNAVGIADVSPASSWLSKSQDLRAVRLRW